MKELVSKRFILAIAAFLTCVANKQWPEAVATVAAYLAAETHRPSVRKARKEDAEP